MRLKLFFTLVPYILQLLGIKKATWEKAKAVVQDVRADYDAGIIAPTARASAFATAMTEVNQKSFWLNILRELATLWLKLKFPSL